MFLKDSLIMKHRIILTEFNPVRGHSNLLSHTSKLLNPNFDVITITTSDNNKCKEGKNIHLSQKYYVPKKNRFFDYICFIIYSFKIFFSIIKYAQKYEIKSIVCITYDEFIQFLLTPFVPKSLNIYLMSHINIDNYGNSSIKRWMFNMIKDRYLHIVQCGFIADYLKSEFSIDNVLVWPHPLNNIKKTHSQRDIDCAGLSYSNDETIILNFIEAEKNKQIFKKNNLRVILKSKTKTYDNGFLTVFQGRIPDSEYDDIINRAYTILIPFPQSFKMRMSGTLMDSLTNKKIVIASPIPVILECKKIYPSIVHVFNLETFVDDLCSIKRQGTKPNDFLSFCDFHGDTNLEKIMYTSLSSSLNKCIVVNSYDF